MKRFVMMVALGFACMTSAQAAQPPVSDLEMKDVSEPIERWSRAGERRFPGESNQIRTCAHEALGTLLAYAHADPQKNNSPYVQEAIEDSKRALTYIAQATWLLDSYDGRNEREEKRYESATECLKLCTEVLKRVSSYKTHGLLLEKRIENVLQVPESLTSPQTWLEHFSDNFQRMRIVVEALYEHPAFEKTRPTPGKAISLDILRNASNFLTVIERAH